MNFSTRKALKPTGSANYKHTFISSVLLHRNFHNWIIFFLHHISSLLISVSGTVHEYKILQYTMEVLLDIIALI